MSRNTTNDLSLSCESPWKSMLSARLVRNAAARVEQRPGSRVMVYVKTAKPRFMVPPISWIVPVRRERGAALDCLGTQLWNLCDGSRTVEEVIDAFAALHSLSFHEARAAVTGYARTLIERGVLAIALPEQPTVDTQR